MTSIITEKLNTLATLWNEQKELSKKVSHHRDALFIDLDRAVNYAVTAATGEENAPYKSVIEFCENLILSLDAKKDQKKINILETIVFVYTYRVKIYLGKNSKGTRAFVKISSIKKMQKLENHIIKSQLKKVTTLWNDTENAAENESYIAALGEYITDLQEKENKRIAAVASAAGLGKVDITAENIEDLIKALQIKARNMK